jgi:hydroxymethylpyrimidine/phosphomethylpyrimidine kinase
VPDRPRLSCALAIGGNDPGGGAGIAADLRAFAAAGAFGCAAIAVLTVQSTAGLVSTRAVPSQQLTAQVREVVRHQRVASVKVGALGSRENVRAVTRWLVGHPQLPTVVDPVMLPTRGHARLLAADALEAMRALVGRASLVTANAHEAALLVGREVATVAQARTAALALCAMGAHAALVKGGHLEGPEAVDVLALRKGGRVILLRARRLRLRPLHGGGCVHASLVAGRLAVDGTAYRKDPMDAVIRAVRWARRVHHRALARAVDVGGPMRVLLP